MAGRRPKPTALRELQGNPGHRSLNKNEPQPTGIPACPKHLSKVAKQEWKRISAELLKIGLLTKIDMAALAGYCSAYARWVDAEQSISKFGAVIKSPKSGYPVANPFIGIGNSALTIMRSFMVEFGMTPSSRSRLSISAADQPKDSFEAFMSTLGGDDIAPALTGPDDPEDHS